MTLSTNIESAPRNAARRIAGFFFAVSFVGSFPALVGVFMYGAFGLMGLEILAEGVARAQSGWKYVELAAGSSAYLAGAAAIWFAFKQIGFYLRRSTGSFAGNARRWWLSTYVCNLVGAGVSLVVMLQEAHVGALISMLWFALLCALSIVAYANEPARHPKRIEEVPHV